MKPNDHFERHRERFEAAREACRGRYYWSPFPEVPGSYPDAETAQARGKATFSAHLNQDFDLDQPGIRSRIGEEISPYTQQPLGIGYPQSKLDSLFSAATQSIDCWAQAGAESRIGILMEVIEQLYQQTFEIANAVMHTAGQSFNMSYAGSGVNALDRGIEALVQAYEAMTAVPGSAQWQRDFGRSTITLQKRYQLVPRGVAVCFSCASFPTWNAYPSMMASLATGNAVIVKPHPGSVLPMAIAVRTFRRVLETAGFDPNLVTMALDSVDNPIGKEIIRHPATAIVDFTGSNAFGSWVEQNSRPALCFTETAGVNTVILESCDDLDAVLRSLATTLCLFSAQMCTSPQNIYIPAQGVRVGSRKIPFADVAEQLANAVSELVSEPRKAAMILAAIQAPATLELLQNLAAQVEPGQRLLSPQPYCHPEYPDARTSSPLILSVTPAQRQLYCQERFGPVSFVIACDSADAALTHATSDVREAGGITGFVYSTDADFLDKAEQAYARAGAQLTCNLTGPMPLNFAAAYSDYHVTGLNPAGNASLTDLAFVSSRFRIAQSRRPI